MNTKLRVKSDNFLLNVQKIVGIVDRFDNDLIRKKIKLTNYQRQTIQNLCELDVQYRTQFNECEHSYSGTMRANINWSYDVINKYFD